MNTVRAKIALIAAFLGINLFLVYILFQSDFRGAPSSELSAERLKKIENIIRDAGYVPEIPLDRAMRAGTFITVSPYPGQRSLVAEDAYSVTSKDQSNIYHCPGKEVEFYSDGRTEIRYMPGVPLDLLGATEEVARQQVEAFLKDNFSFQQLKFDLIQEGGPEERIITYIQGVEGAGLYSSFVRATVKEGGLVSVEYFWHNVLERPPQEQPINMISSAEALLKLVEELGSADQTRHIIRLDLGYYSQEYEAEQWDVPPVWRIIIDYRQTYYINAFTGYLEHSLNINGDGGTFQF